MNFGNPGILNDMKYQTGLILSRVFLVLVALIGLAGVFHLYVESRAVSAPAAEKAPLEAILEKETLTTEDYNLLWEQTGLKPAAVDSLWQKKNRRELLYREQNRFFHAPVYICQDLTGLVNVEAIQNPANFYRFYGLEPGDVLLTSSTHTLGYRHGHSALYIGSGKLIEATEIGEPVSETKAAYWGSYPAGIHLRLKEEVAAETGMSRAELGRSVVQYAEENLLDDEYRLTAGLFHDGVAESETQCAYLIWAAFQSVGIDVSSRDFPITPHSLLVGGKFDIVRVWGFDPAEIDW